MTKRLIISILLLWGTHRAIGQACGSTRDTDLDGTYVSSTSTDQCSGGHVIQYTDLVSPRVQRLAEHGTSHESRSRKPTNALALGHRPKVPDQIASRESQLSQRANLIPIECFDLYTAPVEAIEFQQQIAPFARVFYGRDDAIGCDIPFSVTRGFSAGIYARKRSWA
jgi:hypothetical protein